MSRRAFALLALLGSTAISLAAAELVLRSFFADRFALPASERSLSYRHHPTLGWFPREGSEIRMRAEREITVRHNARGFRDHEHGAKTRPRLLFLGDSFVWGFDVERGERFTNRLQALLPDWEVLNLGVSGYGTDQEWLLLRAEFERYEPDIVVLVFSQTNDRKDNTTNRRYQGYYKPYFEIRGEALELRGVPVPKSVHYYRAERPRLFQVLLVRAALATWRAVAYPKRTVPDPTERLLARMHRFVVERGARFAIAIEGGDPEPLRSFGASRGIPTVHLDTEHRFARFERHWNPDGHIAVSREIREFLNEAGWLGADTE